ncbi:zinc-binding alcohol dehydrogenase family protein [Kribbella sp. NPDC051718]|uniref:zinc-binding alcohol dehydrogenase family protein n=1 Tax=Kribbella sp. NPDC051718 TaxID=3155168 RepID=UPI003416EB8B
MRAAVVTSFGTPPSCQEFPAPVPGGPEEVVVEVVAAGLHPRVRSQAAGSHYTSSAELPLVPGIDGVGRFADGTLRYFVLPDTTLGAMAERTLVDVRRSVVLPEGTDPVVIAAAMNPAMSSWVALRRRVDFQAGQSVLVLGATGNAGRLAVEIANHLGAGQVIAAGRRADRLAALSGADRTTSLADLGEVAADVDVVIDYLWGEPTADAMRAIVTSRRDRDRPLTWIEVGSIAGPTAAIPSAAVRAARLKIVGSGQGSVPTRDILAELPALAEVITTGTLPIDARAVPLAEVETAWKETDASERIVITP